VYGDQIWPVRSEILGSSLHSPFGERVGLITRDDWWKQAGGVSLPVPELMPCHVESVKE
jgi:hypothetical protein